MDVVVIFSVIVLVAFIGAFVSARRFGVLAMGLVAGSVLSSMWSSWLAEEAKRLGDLNIGIPVEVVAMIFLLIAPLIILLLNGPRYYGKLDRILSAVATGLLVGALLVKPLGKFMNLTGQALDVYSWLADAQAYIVTAGIIFGIIDLFLIHSSKRPSPKKH